MHGYLIATLALLPCGKFRLRAEEPESETWQLDRSESSLQVYLEAPEGTTDINGGSSRAVKLTVEHTTWDVMISSWGNTLIQNSVTTAVSGASATFTVVSGEGSLTTSSGTTMDGTFWTTLQIGAQNTQLQADVTYNGMSASAALGFGIYMPAPDPEVWSYTRTEGVLSASLSAGSSSTDVAAGETQTVTVHAQYDTWEVWTSNYGNTETRNPSTSPASGAAISWSLTGDGGLDHTMVQADWNGDATADFTMGQGFSEIAAEVSYSSSAGSVSATLSFAPPASATWEYDHSEGYVSTTLTADGSITDVAGGSQREITAMVIYTSWDMFRRETSPGSGEYELEMRNWASGPAINANVSFSVSGNGTLADSGGNTDENGKRTVSFTMVSGDSTAGGAEVRADVNFLAASGYGTITFSQPPSPPDDPPPPTDPPPADPPPTDLPPTDPPPTDPPPVTWSLQSSSTSVDVTASSSSIGVSYITTEEWLSSAGETETRVNSGPAIGATVSCSVMSGDAIINSYDSSTNTSGAAAISVTAGSQESTIGVVVSFAEQAAFEFFTVSGTSTTPPPTDPPLTDPPPPTATDPTDTVLAEEIEVSGVAIKAHSIIEELDFGAPQSSAGTGGGSASIALEWKTVLEATTEWCNHPTLSSPPVDPPYGYEWAGPPVMGSEVFVPDSSGWDYDWLALSPRRERTDEWRIEWSRKARLVSH